MLLREKTYVARNFSSGLGQITADKAPVFESCGDAQTKILHVLLAVHPSGYEVSDIIHVPVRFVLYS